MVDEELTVIHALEDLDVGLRTEGKQVSHLRFGDKGFFGAIPEMDVGAIFVQNCCFEFLNISQKQPFFCIFSSINLHVSENFCTFAEN